MTRRFYAFLLVAAVGVGTRLAVPDRWCGVHLAITIVVLVTAAVCGVLDERDTP
jgi:hypothetical protein